MNSNIIQLKRGKKETWEKLNPILAYGEPGFVKETGELKIGDGITAWNNLQNIAKESIPYINSSNATPPLTLIDLEPGSYVLNGTFAYSNNPENGQYPFANTLVQIDELDESQKSVSFQVADEIICIFFTYDSYEFKRYNLADIGNGGGSAEGAVLYTKEQNLTEAQQAQARQNIGAMSNGKADDHLNMSGNEIGEIGALRLIDDSGEGVAIFAESTGDGEGIVSFYESLEDGPVVLRNIADGTEDSDAATVGQVKEMVSQSGSGTVKTVNGIAPDENGNVEIEIGGDTETAFDFDETYVITEEDIVDGKYARTTDSHGDPISLSEMQVDFTIPAGSNTGITYLYFYHTSNGTPTNMRVSEFPYQHATEIRRTRTICYKVRDSFYKIDGYGWTEGDSYTALQHTDGTRMNCGVFFNSPTPLNGFYFNVGDGTPVAGTEIRVRGRKAK